MEDNVRPLRGVFDIGDQVVVSGPNIETRGEVISATTPDKMPRLGQDSEQARELVPEWGTDFVILIRNSEGNLLLALHHPGGWRDANGNDLKVTAVAGAG